MPSSGPATSSSAQSTSNGNQGLVTYQLTPGGTMLMTSAPSGPKDYSSSSVFGTSANLTSLEPTFEPTYSQYYPLSRSAATPMPGQQQGKQGNPGKSSGYAVPVSNRPKTPLNYGHHSLPSKMKARGSISSLLVEIEDSFTSHCRSFNAYYNVSSFLNLFSECSH